MSFTALVLKNFNVTVVDNQLYPTMDTAKPCLRIIDAVEGQDLLLKMRRKSVYSLR